MTTGLWRTWSGFALSAFLSLAGFAGAAAAQDRIPPAALAAGAFPGDAGAATAAGAGTPGGPKTRQAGGEKVEIIHLPVIAAAGLIEKDGASVRLAGVTVTAVGAQCGSGQDAWPCGRSARAALQRLVRRRSVECRSAGNASPAQRVAQCSIRGTDIGRWLVAQGWAAADGADYADAEKAAREGRLGIWSPFRPGPALGPLFDTVPALSDAAVIAEVRLSSQSMTLVHRGRIVGHWPVSTARAGKETPTGVWTAKWLARHHRSSLYDDAPMPWSVFYDGDYAVHGTYQTSRLGRPASAGCVRLAPKHAAAFFNLVREEGPGNTLIVIRH
jgi:endonuclease YncB( thermonuclease family)